MPERRRLVAVSPSTEVSPGDGPSPLVCLAGAEPLGVKGPRRGDDDNRSRTAKWEPQGTHPKGRRQTFDRRNTNWQ